MQNELYDKLSRVLTDYEEGENMDFETEAYNLLCEIQNSWELLTAK